MVLAALALAQGPAHPKPVRPPPEARQRSDRDACANWVVLAPGAAVVVQLASSIARIAVANQPHWDLRSLGGKRARIVAGVEGESTIIAWLADVSRLTVCVTVREKAPTRVLGSALTQVSEAEATRAEHEPDADVTATPKP